MSQGDHHGVEAANQRQRSRVWRIAKWVCLGIIFVVVALSLVQVALDPPAQNELRLRGVLEVEADPGVEVYIGEELIGTGPVKVTWDDLLGTSKTQPLAIPLRADTPSPSMEGMGGVTAEILAGEGSEIIWTKQGMSGRGQFLEPFAFAWKQVLLRRSNGELDSLSVLDGEFFARAEKWRRFLIPIRLRSTNKEPNEYFFGPSGGAVSSPAGGPIPTRIIGTQLLVKSGGMWNSEPEHLPEEFADEISKARLWSPSK